MGRMVEEWDRWRRGYAPTESALIVHGPNSDVDLVNELAQRKRLDAGELGEQAIRAVDRDYLLRRGDIVAIRNAAHTFQAPPDEPRPKRIENGQTAIIESVDPKRDTLILLLREPGAEPRLVEVDQARLRAEHAAGNRAAAVRLNYALHTFPAQGATVRGTATLAGHWSQAKQETYVGDTRAIYRHSVHLSREDLGTDGTDEDRISRYAQRISANRQRHASIRRPLDPTLRLAADLPASQPLPVTAAATEPLGASDASPAPVSTRDMSPSTAAPAAAGDVSPGTSPARTCRQHLPCREEHLLDEPPNYLLRVLGPVPEERVARERWQREARRLEALRPHSSAEQQPASAPPTSPSHEFAARPGPSAPSLPLQRRDGPTIRR